MDWLAGARIALTPRPVRPQQVALDVAMLGHYPQAGRVRLERLRALTAALDDMRGAGYGKAVDALLANQLPDGRPLPDAWHNLFHLPLPFRSAAEFHDVFPDARSLDGRYVSTLAGKRCWLAQAVDDFFANGGERLWVVRIPETPADSTLSAQQEFLPAGEPKLHEVDSLRGLATVLAIPSLALVTLPDLERLQVPPRLPDVPRVRIENADPQFVPCGTNTDDDHRERRYSSEIEAQPEPLPLETLLRGVLHLIGKYRPDVQCLFTLPLAYSGSTDAPVADPQALQRIAQIRATGSGHRLRHIQFLFPYLRGSQYSLCSAVGVVAGKIAAVARSKGPWHSIGAQPLISSALPYPRLSLAQTLALRDEPGVGVLNLQQGFGHSGRLMLDDERLSVPALPPEDYVNMTDRNRLEGFRSGEIMRLLGFLRRQLQALGEQLVFNADVTDPRPRLLLERFFHRLYQQGALRGALPEQAWHIVQSNPSKGAIQFDIEIAPAFPIDRIHLTFINQNGEWQGEVQGG